MNNYSLKPVQLHIYHYYDEGLWSSVEYRVVRNMIRKKRHLEMALEGIPSHPSPRVDLEQYSTPSKIAADLLWNAAALGDIEGLKVADLGCGTGVLALGAALLGAKEVVGVDQDPKAIDVAHHEALKEGLENITRFIVADVDFIPGKSRYSVREPAIRGSESPP